MAGGLTLDDLERRRVDGFGDLGAVLDDLACGRRAPAAERGTFLERVARGVAFATFAYDIDGVSMEIAKYGAALEALLRAAGHAAKLHCLGGNFSDKADVVLPPRWRRQRLPDADGWAKWQGGRWFARLFYEEMPEGGAASREVAAEIWRQALVLARQISSYLARHEIGLLLPVNVNSNPGNPAFALALVLASEVSGCPVLNNNHDFYWEGGRPVDERPPGAPPGPRDHFFRNTGNRPFFALLQRLYPWHGDRWLQVNINPLQSQRLIDAFHFPPDRVFTVGTALDEAFFRPCPAAEKRAHRRRMAAILAQGAPHLSAVALDEFLRRTEAWMGAPHPLLCGAAADLVLDPAGEEALYLLQPTRVIGRKRIWRDWELIHALLRHPPFRDAFTRRPAMTLTLHVTGPVPIEHRADLERVLEAYRAV
ncbi:MAG: hypothetical protein ACYTFD_15780, partial [Planctomycetota bacterium]